MKWLRVALRMVVLFILWSMPVMISAQPYFDVGGFTGWHIPGKGAAATPTETYGIAFVSIPVNVSSGSKIVFSPFQENRILNYSDSDLRLKLHSTALPLTFLHSSKDSSWSFTVTFIPRYNSEGFHFKNEFFQAGGAFINVVRINPHLKIRFGLYYNREFFSDYFVPLAGLDWQINPRLQLFGAIPNVMKLEYKMKKYLYGGIAFKSITNSYKAANGLGYYKLEDNHLSLYADCYLTQHLVFMAEAGHTVLRKFQNRTENTFQNFKKDGLIFKAGIYYRIRFDS